MTTLRSSHRRTAATSPSTRVLEAESRYLSPSVSAPTGIVWDHASGSRVFDPDGKEYIDFSSGVLVTNTGHCHPTVVKAIQNQAAQLLNCYDSPHPRRAELVERIARLMPEPLKRILLLTTGAEAIEAAVKIARRSTGRSEVVAFQGSFHGRTYMAMTVGGLSGVKTGYGPLVPNVLHAPFPYPYRCEMMARDPGHDCTVHCLASLDRLLATETTGPLAAVVLEPYQGAGGSIIAPPEFARGIRRLCDETGAVMIVDEVQSGFGRTGSMFAFEQWDLVPDIVVLAKGIGSGIPTSAVVARRDLLEGMPHGSLSSTFGGNPLSCAAALATLEVIEEERLPDRAAYLGQVAMRALEAMAEEATLIGDVRGMGLAIGVELVRDRETKEPATTEAQEVVRQAIEGGLVLIPPIGLYGNVLRVSPPLTIDEDDLGKGLEILRRALMNTRPVDAAVR